MDACRKYGIRLCHQVSTDGAYGDLPLDRPDLYFQKAHTQGKLARVTHGEVFDVTVER